MVVFTPRLQLGRICLITAILNSHYLGPALGQEGSTKEQCEQQGLKWFPLLVGASGPHPLGRCWDPRFPSELAKKDLFHLRRGTLADLAPLLARATPEYRDKITRQLSVSVEKARADREDVTRMSFDPDHGTQISYRATDGTTYLWYPGNTVILVGKWLVREDLFAVRERGNEYVVPYAKVCSLFGANTYNPVTRRVGSSWECTAAGTWDMYLVEARKGDVLDLTKRQRIPFILEKERTSLDALLTRINPPR